MGAKRSLAVFTGESPEVTIFIINESEVLKMSIRSKKIIKSLSNCVFYDYVYDVSH